MRRNSDTESFESESFGPPELFPHGPTRVVFMGAEQIGHLNPTLELVRLLIKSGYEVHYFVPECRRKAVEGVGAIFEAYGEKDWSLMEAAAAEVRSLGMEPCPGLYPGGNMLNTALPGALSLLPTLLPKIRALYPSFLVGDASFPWCKMVAKILDLPLVVSCCSIFYSKAEKEATFGHLRRLDYMWAISAKLEKLYPQLGSQYDPVDSYCNYGDFNIIWTIPEFQPEFTKCEQIKYFGASMPAVLPDFGISSGDYESEGGLHNIIRDAKSLNENTRIVYASMGTVLGQKKWSLRLEPFFDELVKALGDDAQYHVIFSAGASAKNLVLTQHLPKNFHIRQHVPQRAVLKIVDIFITHCGMNSVTEALFHGCPMICCPVFADQYTNADRVAALGCGVPLSSPFRPNFSKNLDHFDAHALRSAVDLLINDYDTFKSNCARVRQLFCQRHRFLLNDAVSEIEQFVSSFSTKENNKESHFVSSSSEDNCDLDYDDLE